MMAADCPELGPTVLDYADVISLVNAEPGVIVLRWRCPCGGTHLTTTGSRGSRQAAPVTQPDYA